MKRGDLLVPGSAGHHTQNHLPDHRLRKEEAAIFRVVPILKNFNHVSHLRRGVPLKEEPAAPLLLGRKAHTSCASHQGSQRAGTQWGKMPDKRAPKPKPHTGFPHCLANLLPLSVMGIRQLLYKLRSHHKNGKLLLPVMTKY